jgi:hypothetical protein
MYEVLKTEKFAVFFSFIVGMSIIAVLIPVCKGDECFLKKAPLVEEMKKSTYHIGSKCYQFKPETVECPASGVIEAFRSGPSWANGPSWAKGPMGFPFARYAKPVWDTKDTLALTIVLGLSLLGACCG